MDLRYALVPMRLLQLSLWSVAFVARIPYSVQHPAAEAVSERRFTQICPDGPTKEL